MTVWLHYCPTHAGQIVGTWTGQPCQFCGSVKGNRWLTPTQAGRILGIKNTKIVDLAKSRHILGEYHSGLWRILRANVECIRAGWMVL